MKLLQTAGKTIRKAAAAVASAVPDRATARARDPFYTDAERRAAVNGGAAGRWLGRRRSRWLP